MKVGLHDGLRRGPTKVDDNAYTNVTAAWVLARTLEPLESFPSRGGANS